MTTRQALLLSLLGSAPWLSAPFVLQRAPRIGRVWPTAPQRHICRYVRDPRAQEDSDGYDPDLSSIFDNEMQV